MGMLSGISRDLGHIFELQIEYEVSHLGKSWSYTRFVLIFDTLSKHDIVEEQEPKTLAKGKKRKTEHGNN